MTIFIRNHIFAVSCKSRLVKDMSDPFVPLCGQSLSSARLGLSSSLLQQCSRECSTALLGLPPQTVVRFSNWISIPIFASTFHPPKLNSSSTCGSPTSSSERPPVCSLRLPHLPPHTVHGRPSLEGTHGLPSGPRVGKRAGPPPFPHPIGPTSQENST